MQATLERRLAADDPQLSPIHSMGYSIKGNVIQIGTMPSTSGQVIAQLEADYADTSLFDVQESGPDTTTCSKLDCWQDPLRGSLGLASTSTSSHYCSSGFVVYGGSPRYYRLMTAGHCKDAGLSWYHAGNRVGEVKKESYYDESDADFAIVGMPQAWAGKVVHRSNTYPAYVMDGVASRTYTVEGMIVCHSGITTRYNCGAIQQLEYRSGNPQTGVDLNHQLVVDYLPEAGDSGSAVFTNSFPVAAVGIQSGRRTLNSFGVVSHIAELSTAEDDRTGSPFNIDGVCSAFDLVWSC